MKKYAVVFVLLIPIFLTGCSVQRKSNSTSPTPTPTASSQTETNPDNQSAIPDSSNQQEADAIETQYQKNFEAASADASSILQNKAKFCSVVIKLNSTGMSQYSDQYFFFASDELLTDYYWLVEFDGLNNFKKKRYFAARRDFKDEITCTSTTMTDAPNFYNAFSNYLTQYQIPNNTVILQMALKDKVWEVTARDSSGATTSSGQTKITTSTSTKTTSPSTTPTASTDENDL